MSVAAAVAALREAALFRDIDERRLKAIALAGRTLRFRPGEVVFRRGDEGDAAYVVLDGVAEVRVPTAAGEEVVATLGRGELFGDIAVLCDRPRTTAIAARDELELLRLDRDTLTGLLADIPDLALRLIRMLAARLEATTLDLARARSGADVR